MSIREHPDDVEDLGWFQVEPAACRAFHPDTAKAVDADQLADPGRAALARRRSPVHGQKTLGAGSGPAYNEGAANPVPRITRVAQEKRRPMNSTTLIILILVLFLVFGGFGYSRRGR